MKLSKITSVTLAAALLSLPLHAGRYPEGAKGEEREQNFIAGETRLGTAVIGGKSGELVAVLNEHGSSICDTGEPENGYREGTCWFSNDSYLELRHRVNEYVGDFTGFPLLFWRFDAGGVPGFVYTSLEGKSGRFETLLGMIARLRIDKNLRPETEARQKSRWGIYHVALPEMKEKRIYGFDVEGVRLLI